MKQTFQIEWQLLMNKNMKTDLKKGVLRKWIMDIDETKSRLGIQVWKCERDFNEMFCVVLLILGAGKIMI